MWRLQIPGPIRCEMSADAASVVARDTGKVGKMSRYVLAGALFLSVCAAFPAYCRSATGPAEMPVAAASCAPGDHKESVQGETTLAERFSPGPSKAYTCNLELLGQFEGEGASDGLDMFDSCAYFSIIPGPGIQHPGVAVMDLSDVRRPTAVLYLSSPAMLDSQESVAVSRTSKLLIASSMSAPDPAPIDLYDLEADCRHPVLRSSVSFAHLYSHAGQFTSDGGTYYGAKWRSDPKEPPPSAVFALDVRDRTTPRLIGSWNPPEGSWLTHGVVVNEEGTRAYVALKRLVDDREGAKSPNGLAVLEITEMQARRPSAQMHLLGTLFWDDTHAAEGMQVFRIGGHPYLVFSDNEGAIGYTAPPSPDVCNSGKPGHGFARIIDISDDTRPRTLSKLMLEVAAPKNCTKVMHDPTSYGGYGSFACSVDHEDNAKLLACASFEAGLRVFDIRNPVHPVEVAYYKPPARRRQSRPGSILTSIVGEGQDHTVDSVITFPRFRDTDKIVFTSADNGLQIVRFSEPFELSHPDLFRN